MFRSSRIWRTPVVRDHIVSRIGQRYTAERSDDNLRAAAKLLEHAPNEGAVSSLIKGMETGLEGDPVENVPKEMAAAISKLWRERTHDAVLTKLAIRLQHPDALNEALATIADRKGSASDQSKLIALIAEQRNKSAIPTLSNLLRLEKSSRRQLELVTALQRFSTVRVADLFIDELPKWSGSVRIAAMNAMASRLEWAQLLLDAVDADAIRKEWVAVGNLLAIQEFGCDHCDGLIRKHWGRLRNSPEDKRKEISRVMQLAAKLDGDQKKGEELYKMLCANCHRMGRIGKRIGPELTGYERDNLQFIIPAIVDPSLAIREEYTTFSLLTRDGQNLSGFLSREDPQSVTMMDMTGTKQVIPRRDIVNLEASHTSLMPEGLTAALNNEQLRDLLTFFVKHAGK